MKNTSNIRFLVQSAIIAAAYTALTFVSFSLGLSSGFVQLRLSEALCVLPVFFPAAVPGLFVGCFISNVLTGSILPDVIFGSLATLIGAILTHRLKAYKLLPLAPPIISNTIILPLVLRYAYGLEGSYALFAVSIFAGEFLSCGVLGYLLKRLLQKYKNYF